jgi:hypothetical protein
VGRKQRPARPQLLVQRRVLMLKQLVDKPLVLQGFLAADRQRPLVIRPGRWRLAPEAIRDHARTLAMGAW